MKIKNINLINEIESIYTKQEERLGGLFVMRSTFANKLIEWDYNRSIKNSINKNPYFYNKDKELMELMKWRKDILDQSIKGLEDYIISLNKVVEIIRGQCKTIN